MTTPADAPQVNVPALIDAQKIGTFQIRVAVLCAAVVFMDGFDAQAIGYVAPTLSKAWSLKPGELGPVFAAGLFGLMLGALAFSPLADRIGRKPVIIFCTLWFGVTSLLTVTAESTTSLLVWRFVTGLGLGGAMPNPIALTCEYAMVMFIGFSLGSAVGGAIAAQLAPSYGWQSVFWLGGIFPLLLAPVLIFWLPESIRLLALKGTRNEYVARLIRAINPALRFAPGTRFIAPEEHPEGFPVEHLFTEGRALATVLIWVMFFTNLLVIYFCATWLPTVINNTGVSVRLAVIATALFQVGGIVGTLVLAVLIERFGPYRVLAGAYFAAAILIAAIGQAGSTIELVIPAVFGAGFCVVGAQIGANALTATFYPTFIRSTGVGWALGIGRVGSIIGPLLGGMMLSLQWHIPTIFFAGAVPVLIAGCAVLAMGRLPKIAKHQGPSALPAM
ncbi:MAG: MFS transporter [Alphaproteobacteria bacterium]|nr:MAG: MFS transporter [Alphaproteobacteria bacterium]